MFPIIKSGLRLAALALATCLSLRAMAAEQIVVSNYGVAANGMSYAIAMEKGFFKDEGADVSGVLSSAGGGTTVRNLMTGHLSYGEIDLAGTVAAIQQGADLKIISDNVLTVAEFVWAVKPDAPIKTIQELKGKKIGYTNPRSTSQALDILLLEQAGLKPDEAELVKTGGFGEAVVALNLGLIDASAIADPVWSKNKSQFRVLVSASDVLPPLCNVIGVTTAEAAATKGDFIRAILRGRRKAVEFMSAHPDEAADIVAKAYNLDVEVAKSTIHNLVAPSKSGVPYWGPGYFDMAGMDRMIRAQKLVGALSGDVDWSKIVDTSFLADDLKTKK
ncbi:MAG TPA: ABC transporter substrate-binding protein [Xanthobacteraceae bacterium]|jgi:NitT/TauT family transport system substrate-binding protein|nr:ABC transporter substrate-binding protein [Xanthobacteraceae bacterium]